MGGILFVVSAPSGAGKSTLGAELLKTDPNLVYSVSLTTRSPRRGESHGKDYFFVAEDEFLKRRKKGDLIESALVHGFWYGTPQDQLEKLLREGRDVLLDIDVQGGRQIKKLFPSAVLIFIAPPSITELEHRLRTRSQDDEAAIQKRLDNARNEIAQAGDYEYLILNRDIGESVQKLRSIVWAERSKMDPEVLKGV
ncbi:MAG: guanylate kinase [Elusimicrobia bacterium RIFCSPLOWO2_01_FULL_54_10]|nr:MAG: guanylate kinase [Elusimicrobia bacterium RIFCSPLOWO2_01_FULL_54_10]